MIPDFPIPDSGFPNSEFRMAYGNPRIPHHEVVGAAEVVKESFITGPREGVGHWVSNTNSGVGHWASEGGSWLPSVKYWNRDYGQRKEGTTHKKGIEWPTHETSGKRPKEGRKAVAGVHTL